RLSRRGAFLFVPSLDHVGPFARSVADLALCYDLMQGPDAADPVCRGRPVEPTHDALDDGDEIRIAVADGYYAQSGAPEAHAAVARVAEALSIERRVSLPEPEKARAAAFVITASEGAGQHLDNLRIRAGDFDPMTRDRFLAGALVPAAWVLRAQRFRRRYRDAVAAAFQDVDVVLAPTTPVPAPEIGQETMLLNGVEMPSRPNLGLFTQPLSLIGLPIVSVPVMGEGGLPLGVQVIARPWREDHALKVARAIERAGLTIAPERP
ncbi:MAG TPA: amidase family protein, partial [Propylenella sp.]